MLINKHDRVQTIEQPLPSDPPIGATGTAIESSSVPYVNWDAQYPVGVPYLGHPNVKAVIADTLKVLPAIQPFTGATSMNPTTQNLVTKIIVAVVSLVLRRKDVQAHLSKATSMFDGVLKNIDKSLDVLHAEVGAHNTKVHNLKEQVQSERLLAESKNEAQYKLRALKSKITDIVG